MLQRRKPPPADFSKLMDAFYAKAGLDPLIPDAKGHYKIELNDDNRPVFCFKNSDCTGTVYASVVTVEPNCAKSSELIIELLSRFTGFLKSRKYVLCLDRQSNEIILFRRFNLKTVTAAYLYCILEDFVNGLCTFRWLAASGSTAGPAAIAGRLL